MSTRTVLLTDAMTGRPVEATLHLALAEARVRAVEVIWAPLRAALRAQHSHWDWDYKAGFLVDPGVRCLGIDRVGRMQGMMLLRETGFMARLDPDRGQPLVYVDYVESAPWNIPVGTREYPGVGLMLIQEAVRRSVDLGFGGRIGLHALPQVETFYSRKCGMVGCGPDAGYHGLEYFEFTAADARTFAEV